MKKFVMKVLVCVVIGLMVLPASAAIILSDDFVGAAGSSPDAAKWSASAGIVLDGAGNAVFTVAPGQNMDSLASFNYLPTVGEPIGRLTVKLTDLPLSPNVILGLSSAGFAGNQEKFVNIRTDQGANWAIMIGDNTTNGGFFTDVPRWDHSGTWEFDWSLNQVQIYYNGVLKLDTAVTLPGYNNTTQWYIPQIAMRPSFTMYGGADSDAVDSVNWESIPEPATMALLGFGGILAMRKRKQ